MAAHTGHSRTTPSRAEPRNSVTATETPTRIYRHTITEPNSSTESRKPQMMPPPSFSKLKKHRRPKITIFPSHTLLRMCLRRPTNPRRLVQQLITQSVSQRRLIPRRLHPRKKRRSQTPLLWLSRPRTATFLEMRIRRNVMTCSLVQ